MEKRCFKCRRLKTLDQFYKHKAMADGHLNKCIGCAKKDVKRRYHDPESRRKIRDYEKLRFKDPKRKAKLIEYQRAKRARNPGKYKARTKINNQIRDGTLMRLPCETCSRPNAEAHHYDYRKPTTVRWLCFTHHREEHGQKVI